MNADEIFQRFMLVQQEQLSAFDGLADAVDHVAHSRPSPRQRVILSNNLVVGLTARIEEALRECFKEYLLVAQECDLLFTEMRPQLQKASYKGALEALKRLEKTGDWQSAAVIIGELQDCLSGTKKFQLEIERVIDNQGNMRSKQITDIAQRFGITDFWGSIALAESFKEYFGEPTVDTLKTQIIQKWNGIFDERDLVVHRVSQASGWSAEMILEHITFTKLVVEQIGTSLASDCDSWIRECDGGRIPRA